MRGESCVVGFFWFLSRFAGSCRGLLVPFPVCWFLSWFAGSFPSFLVPLAFYLMASYRASWKSGSTVMK